MITRLVCFFSLWLAALAVQAQEATFKGTLQYPYDGEVRVLLYDGNAYGRHRLGTPLDTLVTEGKHVETSLNPGTYTIAVEGEQYDRLVFPLYLPPGTTEEVQIMLVFSDTSSTADPAGIVSSSTVSWSDTSLNPAYQRLRDHLLVIEQEQRLLVPQAIQGTLEEAQLTAYGHQFDSVAEQYSQHFPQTVAENRLVSLRYLHPAMTQTFQLEKASASPAEYDTLFRSEAFSDFMKQTMAAVETLDPGSVLATSAAVPQLVELDRYLAKSPFLRQTFGLAEGHFHRYVLNYTSTLSDKEVAADILFRASYSYLRHLEGADRGVEILMKLKQEYPTSYYVQEGVVDTQLTGLRMIEGEIAPAFAVKSLAGDSITLASLAGKYVYLDFWGSWCKPCVEELPNLKALTAAFSQDRLQVVGLARDSEESLTAFLEKQPLPYPNALAPQAVEAYGVTSFPTTFLISPDGVIVAKNFRGQNLKQLVEEAIQSHEATATEGSKDSSRQ